MVVVIITKATPYKLEFTKNNNIKFSNSFVYLNFSNIIISISYIGIY